MPRKIATRQKAAPAKSKPEARKSRPRAVRGAVRGTILDALASGPKTRKQLLEMGTFSAPSLYLNLDRLVKEKLIELGGRGGLVSLLEKIEADSDTPPAQTAAPRAKKSTKVIAASRKSDRIPGSLHTAMSTITRRLRGPERLSEKLFVLEQLANTTPPAVAELLQAIRQDLLTISNAGA